jgi:hypothetical protein
MRSSPLRGFAIALVSVGLIAPSAGAILKKYVLRMSQVLSSTNVSPDPKVTPGWCVADTPVVVTRCRAVIDDSGASPILTKFLHVRDKTATTLVPALGGFIFTSSRYDEGPRGEFTGTGSTDTTIAWGLLTGWTISGTHWCHSSPAVICVLGDRVPDDSSDPFLESGFYDLGTWTFHGTGFTARPYIFQTFEDQPGNMSYRFSGYEVLGGTIPALPAVGLAVLGGSLVLGGLAALRRRDG